MADEEQAQEATPEETTGSEDKASAQPPARAASGMNTIVVIAVGLAVMIVTPVLSFLVNSRMMPKPIAEADLKKTESGETTTFAMDEIRVNILGTKATRYVVMKPHLVLSDAALQGELEALKPLLADRVSTAISRRTLDDLEGPDARVSLRRDIMNEVNAAIRNRMKGAVVDVYLVDFLIQ